MDTVVTLQSVIGWKVTEVITLHITVHVKSLKHVTKCTIIMLLIDVLIVKCNISLYLTIIKLWKNTHLLNCKT